MVAPRAAATVGVAPRAVCRTGSAAMPIRSATDRFVFNKCDEDSTVSRILKNIYAMNTPLITDVVKGRTMLRLHVKQNQKQNDKCNFAFFLLRTTKTKSKSKPGQTIPLPNANNVPTAIFTTSIIAFLKDR